MNREEILEILNLKHVILCGGSESDRKRLIEAVSEGFNKDKTAVFRIPPGIRSFEGFIDTARRIFPIKPLLKDQTVEEMSYDQLNDVLLDWVEEGERSTFIIWEEIGSLEPKDDLYGLISEFVTRKYILEDYFRSKGKLRLLLSSSLDLSDYFNSAKIYFGRDPNDPVKDDQIVRSSLEIINLNKNS
jgi:hypothetical protein